MKKISIKNKLYLNIVPIIIVGIILSFSLLYYIANQKYVDYLNEQYEDDVEYLQKVATDILKTGTIPERDYIKLPENSSGIKIFDEKNSLVYSYDAKNDPKGGMMRDMSCCNFISYSLDGYGRLDVYSHCEIDETEISVGFRRDLIVAVILAGLVTILISIIIINRIANKMSSELNSISKYANKIETGILDNKVKTDIAEIDNIKNSLFNLGARLSEKERLRKEKIDIIKHQLSTPLTIIKTTLEGMIDDVIDFDKDYIKRCLVENDRIREKMENLYLEIEKNSDEINKESINLKDLIQEIINNFIASFQQKGVKIVAELNDRILETDKNILVSSVYNILSNAYKYTSKGDKVFIKLSDKLIISDTGIGIGDIDKDKIFEAYYRGMNSENFHGKGLGLYDTKKNLEKLGYSIYLDRNSKDTTFIIDFNGKDKE